MPTYYEEQQQGLGDRFVSELEKQFAILSEYPEYYSYIDNEQIFRDVAIDKFPFVIIYDIVGQEVNIYAIYPTHKRPFRSLGR